MSTQRLNGPKMSQRGTKAFTDDQRDLINKLLTDGRAMMEAPRGPIEFFALTGKPKSANEAAAAKLLNDLDKCPHYFVLGCLMDRQIATSRAWIIPYLIGEEAGGIELKHFAALSEKKLITLFETRNFHRFNEKQAKVFYAGVQDIEKKYGGDASRIWAGAPPSARVIRRFLEFYGAGVKIATMAANILVRDFKVPMVGLSSIDISPDRRVMRFFKTHHLLRPEAGTDELIYLARELSPEFPGLLDYAAWLEGASSALSERMNF
jgi:endonuclease-3